MESVLLCVGKTDQGEIQQLIEQYSQQQIAQKLTALQQRIKQFAQQLPKYKTTIKMPSVTEHCQISDPAISIGVTDEPISSK